MELALNLEWLALAIAMCWLWVRHARRDARGCSRQFVSLGLVLFMMFVVITIYDDMAMAQNPAETRCFQREEDSGALAHTPLHSDGASAPALAAELRFNMFHFARPGNLVDSIATVPALSSIQNRPPPAA